MLAQSLSWLQASETKLSIEFHFRLQKVVFFLQRLFFQFWRSPLLSGARSVDVDVDVDWIESKNVTLKRRLHRRRRRYFLTKRRRFRFEEKFHTSGQK